MNTVFLDSHADINPLYLQTLATHCGVISDPKAVMTLVMTSKQLELRKRDEPKLGAISVDFITGAIAHRRRYGGGRKEAIAKAVGMKGSSLPDVVDATAGLGRDAFILACLGCKVRMFERNPIVASLLEDGLRRAYADFELGIWLQEHLTLHHGSSLHKLSQLRPAPDVIYLDPMFPNRKKSALVKKEMRILQFFLSGDDDADTLLSSSLVVARRRVVVKRPNYAPPLSGIAGQTYITTKKHRFDIYFPQKNK